MTLIATLPRYIGCGQVTKRPIFEFISSTISPNAQVVVFPRADDYTFGILQSTLHWTWFTERCSTLTERYRYTSNTVFDSFPWPQAPDKKTVQAIAKAARTLRVERRKLCTQHGLSLRQLYRSAELPGDHPLDDALADLDDQVRKAYGMKANADPLRFLFDLNQELAALEAAGKSIVGPGLPPAFATPPNVISDDCLKMPQQL